MGAHFIHSFAMTQKYDVVQVVKLTPKKLFYSRISPYNAQFLEKYSHLKDFMFGSVLTKVFGSRNQRLVKQMGKTVSQINALEADFEALSDDAIKAKTEELKKRVSEGEKLDSVLIEAFALTREASKRSLGLRHFDVQLVGGIVLHDGKIAEMRTGEGKTLVATLPAYLNALTGKPVHIVTVNDYLAQRDSGWMGKVFQQLGLKVGVIYSGQPYDEKQAAYRCDIVYGTNNEFGFDYLRDNMAFQKERRAQTELNFAIVDEVDSILIDEARTPLVISGPAEESTDLYQKINKIVPNLTQQMEEEGPGDFSLDEKSKQVFMTEEGHEHAEQLLEKAGMLPEGSSLYDVSNISLLHHLYAALRARYLFQKDVDYIIRDGQIVIIDEFTGRMMPGRRWGDGLHQAIEAKENVKIQQENQTLASITFQNYFRLYEKLAGMTGTADTEATEFQQIYGLEVVVIPTNKDMIRDDSADVVYRTTKEKYTAIVESIKEARAKNQPILVGTASIESSELLSKFLNKEKIEHQVLNAKHHEKEAQIIAEAGQPGAVTIATNMAGRGTDIVLGGNLELELQAANDDSQKEKIRQDWQQRHAQVIEAGGLFVIGTERNESRRVDNQLRGRSGRQGDPGLSRFYLSMEDGLMRIFGSDRVAGLMEKMGMEEGEAIEHPWVTKAIENAQKKVEGKNFDARKQLLEYDDVANEQRKVVYQERNALMDSDDISENIETIREEVVNNIISRHIPYQSMEEQWDVPALEKDLLDEFNLKLPVGEWLEKDDELHEETLRDKILEEVIAVNKEKEQRYSPEIVRQVEKAIMLQMLDAHWKEHLANMDHLRQGIGLRGYAQKNPKQEYKRESFELFSRMLDTVKTSVITTLAKFEINTEAVPQPEPQVDESKMKFEHADAQRPQRDSRVGHETAVSDGQQPYVREMPKVGRNEPCPCGSGKKYKRCHGKLS